MNKKSGTSKDAADKLDKRHSPQDSETLARVVAVHECVFSRLPVVALKLGGAVGPAFLGQNPLHVLREVRSDHAVRHRAARAVHVFLAQAQAPFAVHRTQVHLANLNRGQAQATNAALQKQMTGINKKIENFLDRIIE